MKSRLKQLFNTTAVKLSLKYSILYIFIFGIILLSIYWFITHFVQDQIKASLTQERIKIEKLFQKDGIKQIVAYIKLHEQYKGEDHRYYLLMNKNGKILAGDLKRWPKNLLVNKKIQNVWISEKNIIGKVPDGDGYWPMIAFNLGNRYKMLIAQGIKGTEDLRETMFVFLAVMFGIVVILTLILGVLLGGKVLDHVERISHACKKIMSGNLSERIEITSKNDEFDKISFQINNMLDNIESLVSKNKQIVYNIAHDLRTPLNRIKSRLEVEMISDKNNECSNILEETLKDLDNIITTFNSILQIAYAESGAAKKEWEKVNLAEIVLSVVDLYLPLIEDKLLELKLDLPESANVNGNKKLLIQAVSNILDNAVKYTDSGGKIRISIKKEDLYTALLVCDTGIGVSEKYYNEIIKPFVRLDKSRHTAGNGLGLSLVKAVVDIHNAKLVFENSNPGLCVKIIFAHP